MIENYKEAFEKTRSAGIIAAGALDEVAKMPALGHELNRSTIYVMNTLMTMVLSQLHFLQRFSKIMLHIS